MSIRWIRNVVIDGEKSTLEVQLGERHIGDKCYTRIGKETERWFDAKTHDRASVLEQGLSVLRKRLSGKKIEYPGGRPYEWR